MYRTYGRLDEAPLMDGDVGFVGVDERDPSNVAPGFVSEAINYMFRDGVARPRKGMVFLPWLNDASSFPWVFPHDFEVPRPLAGDVLAATVFNDADDLEWVIVATPTKVYRMREGFTPVEVTLPSPAVTLRECSFVQCFNTLLMFRGTQYPVLEMTDVRRGFAAVTQTGNTISGAGTYNPADGTEAIPQAGSGIFMQNRVFVPHSRDLVAASDYLNYTRYSAIRADFRVNQGSADRLVALYKVGESSLIAFKEQSIYQIDGVYGDLSELRQQELTREFGLVARRAVVSVGADVWFLTQRGVTSLGQILDNKVKASAVTFTDPLVRTMRRVNWLYAAGAAATYFDGKFFLALPLDDATVTNASGSYSGVNNAILVFDTANSAWSGIWQGPGIMVKEWLQFTWAGKRRLGFLGGDGMVAMLDFTFEDQARMDPDTGVMQAAIETRLVTRGYRCDGGEDSKLSGTRMKRYRSLTVTLGTWAPDYNVSAVVDGVNEVEPVVEGKVKDRRRYVKPFDARPWDESNVNDDHGEPGREDYSVAMGSSGVQGTAIDLGSGVNFEGMQEAPERYRMNLEGRFCQVLVENVQGRVEVKAVGIEARAGRRRNGVLI